MSASPDAQRLPYLPGLDGLRAVAIIAVVAFHLGIDVPGGFLGVDLFLVLSGYLITSLLIDEKQRTGGIALGRFWVRRIRRLIPALVAMLAASAAWLLIIDADALARMRGAYLASVGYVTNWYFMLIPPDHFGDIPRPAIVEHLWSLAVEEQFYLLWPLVMAGALLIIPRRTGWLLAGVMLGAGASAALGVTLYHQGADPVRLYYGTDVRVVALLAGAALAVAASPQRLAAWAPRVAVSWIGPVALVAFIACALGMRQDGVYFGGGMAAVAILGVILVIFAGTPHGPLGRGLAWSPMIWIGQRSYGIYLWHLPVIVLLGPYFGPDLAEIPRVVLGACITVGLAALSYRYLEQPIRTRGFRGAFRRAKP